MVVVCKHCNTIMDIVTDDTYCCGFCGTSVDKGGSTYKWLDGDTDIQWMNGRPNCQHEIDKNSYSGMRCKKCSAFYCL